MRSIVKTNSKKQLTLFSYLATLLAVHLVFLILALVGVFELPFKQLWSIQLTSILLVLISAQLLPIFLPNGFHRLRFPVHGSGEKVGRACRLLRAGANWPA
jgi:hypothetical protein